jgi:hypothetical protein
MYIKSHIYIRYLKHIYVDMYYTGMCFATHILCMYLYIYIGPVFRSWQYGEGGCGGWGGD